MQPRFGLLQVDFSLNIDLDSVVVGCDALDVDGLVVALLLAIFGLAGKS